MNTYAWVLFDVTVTDLIQWPSVYGYDGWWADRKTARNHLQTVRAVFQVKLTTLTLVNFLCGKGANDEPKWVATAHRYGLSTKEVNDFLESSAGSNHLRGPQAERVGLIIDANTLIDTLWWQEISKLIATFSLPVWVYYGLDLVPGPLPHQWHAKYLPSASQVAQVRAVWPKDGVRTLVPESLPVENQWASTTIENIGWPPAAASDAPAAAPQAHMPVPRPD